MSRPRISRFTMDLETKQIDLGSEVRIFEYDAQIFCCCHVGGGMGFDSRGQPLRDDRRHELVAGHRRLLGQQPDGQVPDRPERRPRARTAARRRSPTRTRAGPRATPTTTTARCCGSSRSTSPRTAAAGGRASARPTRCPTRRRRTARTCSTAARAAAARPSPRSTPWACATRRAWRSIRRPTCRTPRGSARTPARRASTLGPSTYESASQIDRAGNYGWPYCMGNGQAYRDRVADGAGADDQRAGLRRRRPGHRRHRRLVRLRQHRQRLAEQHGSDDAAARDRHRDGRRHDAPRTTSGTAAATRATAPNGCPTFPRDRGADERAQLRRRADAAVPVRAQPRHDGHERPGVPLRRRGDGSTRAAGPSTGTAAGSSTTTAATASSTACCSTRRPTRTAASRSTRTACARRCRGPRRLHGLEVRRRRRAVRADVRRLLPRQPQRRHLPLRLHRRRRTRRPPTRRATSARPHACSSRAPARAACPYEWDFGDGETSTAANPPHMYDDTGTLRRRADRHVRGRRDGLEDDPGRGGLTSDDIAPVTTHR